jgi:hypothetical protein
MNTAVSFTSSHLAPCGINCGTCRAYQRNRNSCPGCRIGSEEKIPHCSKCSIRNCESLEKLTSGFCYECDKFPCVILIKIDKRYQTKYRSSLIQNLRTINKTQMKDYLAQESKKWTCHNCGSVLCVHRTACTECGKEY